jgi:hypothetical protein
MRGGLEEREMEVKGTYRRAGETSDGGGTSSIAKHVEIQNQVAVSRTPVLSPSQFSPLPMLIPPSAR